MKKDRTLLYSVIVIAVSVGLALILIINVKQKQVEGIKKMNGVVITPVDKLDAECFSTSPVTDNDNFSTSVNRIFSLMDVYCKPNSHSNSVRIKHGVQDIIYVPDTDTKILLYKAYKENDGIIYFNLNDGSEYYGK